MFPLAQKKISKRLELKQNKATGGFDKVNQQFKEGLNVQIEKLMKNANITVFHKYFFSFSVINCKEDLY